MNRRTEAVVNYARNGAVNEIPSIFVKPFDMGFTLITFKSILIDLHRSQVSRAIVWFALNISILYSALKFFNDPFQRIRYLALGPWIQRFVTSLCYFGTFLQRIQQTARSSIEAMDVTCSNTECACFPVYKDDQYHAHGDTKSTNTSGSRNRFRMAISGRSIVARVTRP